MSARLDNGQTDGRIPRPLHWLVMRRLFTEMIRESRWALMAEKEYRLERKRQTDNLWPEEVPTSGTMSGWLRNGREAKEYKQQLRRSNDQAEAREPDRDSGNQTGTKGSK